MPADAELLALEADLVTDPLSGVPGHRGAPGHLGPQHQGRGGRGQGRNRAGPQLLPLPGPQSGLRGHDVTTS